MTRRRLALVAALACAVAAGAGCGPACRGIDVKTIDLQCSASSTFDGEIHFDDAATYASFLLDDCLPEDTDQQRQALVDAVDFTTDAVFVSSGLRQQTARCIADRKQDGVDVCDDGLRVAFADTLSDADPCGGRWTVAFSLPRSELRAALDTPIGQ